MSLRFALVCIFLLASFATAADNTGGVPLIDRDLIFGNPEISAAQLSPDGKYLAFLKPWKDTRNIYVKAIGEPFSAAHLLTTEAHRPIAGFFWTRDSKYVLYIKDNDGDENFNIFAVDPTAKPASGTDAAPSRDLTGLKGVRVEIFEVPKNDPDIHLHRPERPRQGLARSVQTQTLDRHERVGSQEYRAHHRMGL